LKSKLPSAANPPSAGIIKASSNERTRINDAVFSLKQPSPKKVHILYIFREI